MFINDRIHLKYSKNYASELNAEMAVHQALGDEGFDLIVICKEGRFVPIIKWDSKNEHRVADSAHIGFYTIL